MPLPIRIANNIDFGKSWTYNLCALYSRHVYNTLNSGAQMYIIQTKFQIIEIKRDK